MSKMPKIALLVETARGYGREVLKGIVRYARLHGPWAFYVTPGDFAQSLPRMEEWGGTGIIARIETRAGCQVHLGDEAPGHRHGPVRIATCGREAPGRGCASWIRIRKGPCGWLPTLEGKGAFVIYAFVGIAGKVWSDRRQQSLLPSTCPTPASRLTFTRMRVVADIPWSREQDGHGTLAGRSSQAAGHHGLQRRPWPGGSEACRQPKVRFPEEGL